jgi:hypothetical protein
MTDLIACLSYGKDTWTEVLDLIEKGEFETNYLVVNSFFKDKLSSIKSKKNIKVILIDLSNNINEIIDEIYSNLKGTIIYFDLAVNIVSGTGKEHMAILSAILKLGIGIRFVKIENDIITEI